MKFEQYANATVNPVKYNILGLTLLPLSLGHFLNMRAYGCEYASDTTTEVDVVDLIIGVLICSMTYEQFREFVASDRFFKEVRHWGKVIQKKTKKDKTFNIFERLELFKQYLEDGTKFPYVELVNESPNNQSSVSHWSLHLSTVLKSKLNLTTTEVMNMPLTQAFALYFQYLELEGIVRLNYEPKEQYQNYLNEINKLKKELTP